MGIIGRQEGSMSPRAIGRRRDRNYRTRTDERTNGRKCREMHTRMRVLRSVERQRREAESTNWREFFARHSQDPSQRVIYAYIRALMGGARVIQNLTSDKVGGEIRGQVQGRRKY